MEFGTFNNYNSTLAYRDANLLDDNTQGQNKNVDKIGTEFDSITKTRKVELADFIRLSTKKSLEQIRKELATQGGPSKAEVNYEEKLQAELARDKILESLMEIYIYYSKEKVSKTDIKYIQKQVGVNSDGVFGPNTFSKIMENIPEQYREIFISYTKDRKSVNLPSLKDLVEGFRAQGKVLALKETQSIDNIPEGYELVDVIASAYYGPKKGQKKYATGTYKGDLRLQGEGKYTASGVKPKPGMIAAPKNWDFGTEIILPSELSSIIGKSRVTVEDRGGAIVNKGKRGYKHDRIDIFFGYGEVALEKALNWGKKKVKILVAKNESSNNFS